MEQATSEVVSLDRILAVTGVVAAEVLAKVGKEIALGRFVEELAEGVKVFAQDLNPACIQVDSKPEDEARGTVQFRVRWLPPKNAECELLGGSHDGRRAHVREHRDGLPEPVLFMPTRRDPMNMAAEDVLGPPLSFASKEEYRLAGFRNDSARWVYRIA
jgi:hypothetical protein